LRPATTTTRKEEDELDSDVEEDEDVEGSEDMGKRAQQRSNAKRRKSNKLMTYFVTVKRNVSFNNKEIFFLMHINCILLTATKPLCLKCFRTKSVEFQNQVY